MKHYIPLCSLLLAAACATESPEAWAPPVTNVADVLPSSSTIVLDTPEGNPVGKIAQVVRDNGTFLVVDRMASDIKVFDEAGRYREAWGGAGDGPGEYRGPSGMAVLTDGRYAVVDGRSRVTLLDRNGTFLARWEAPIRPVHSMLVGQDGGTILLGGPVLRGADAPAAAAGHDVHVFTPEGTYIRSLIPAPAPAAPPETSFLGVRMARAGDLLMVGRYSRNAIHYRELGSGREWSALTGEPVYEAPDWSQAKGRTVEDAVRFAEPYFWLENIVALDCGVHAVSFRRTRSRVSEYRHVLRDPGGSDIAVTHPTPMEIVGSDGAVLFGAEFLPEGEVRLSTHRLPPEHGCDPPS